MNFNLRKIQFDRPRPRRFNIEEERKLTDDDHRQRRDDDDDDLRKKSAELQPRGHFADGRPALEVVGCRSARYFNRNKVTSIVPRNKLKRRSPTDVRASVRLDIYPALLITSRFQSVIWLGPEFVRGGVDGAL